MSPYQEGKYVSLAIIAVLMPQTQNPWPRDEIFGISPHLRRIVAPHTTIREILKVSKELFTWRSQMVSPLHNLDSEKNRTD